MEFQKTCNIIVSPFFYVPWLLLMIVAYFYLDLPITLFFSHLKETTPIVFKIFSVITQFGSTNAYAIFALLLLIGGGLLRNKRFFFSGVYIILSILIAIHLCGYIKAFAGRARPQLYLTEHLYGFYLLGKNDAMWSFPSGHTTLAFSAATAFSLIFPRFWGYFFVLAGLVGFSRLVVLMHYLSDVMGGFLFGLYCKLYTFSFI